ncbi:molybdate-binding periplasmic protein precursor [bacterium BMS3Bbin07]|nr:molybdate-binding periplasmic protein precursor [bacterium BMS3Bbin07]
MRWFHSLEFRRIFSLSILLVFLVVGGRNAGAAESLTVSAAMSLKNAFEDIGRVFEAKHGGVKVYFNFAGSGTLSRQIESGAPVDVFASASMRYMDEVERKGFIIGASRRNFAGNSIVLIVPSASGFQLSSLRGLLNEGIRRIAIGNPRTVPAGEYSEEALKHFELRDRLGDKLILAGNVRQVLDYVARGEVDAGMVYASDAGARPDEVKIAVEVPAGSHTAVLYPAAVVRGSDNTALAAEFIDMVTSEKGQKILRDYGFIPLGKEKDLERHK